MSIRNRRPAKRNKCRMKSHQLTDSNQYLTTMHGADMHVLAYGRNIARDVAAGIGCATVAAAAAAMAVPAATAVGWRWAASARRSIKAGGSLVRRARLGQVEVLQERAMLLRSMALVWRASMPAGLSVRLFPRLCIATGPRTHDNRRSRPASGRRMNYVIELKIVAIDWRYNEAAAISDRTRTMPWRRDISKCFLTLFSSSHKLVRLFHMQMASATTSLINVDVLASVVEGLLNNYSGRSVERTSHET